MKILRNIQLTSIVDKFSSCILYYKNLSCTNQTEASHILLHFQNFQKDILCKKNCYNTRIYLLIWSRDPVA